MLFVKNGFLRYIILPNKTIGGLFLTITDYSIIVEPEVILQTESLGFLLTC